MTPQERQSFDVERIRVVPARADESLATLCRRAKSVLDIELIAVLNGMQIDDALAQDQPIKVVVKEPYR